jgi:hypothetical protein
MASDRRTGGARALAALVPRVAREAFARRGFHQAAVITDWPAIVGDELARQCAPERLSRDGTLTVRAPGTVALLLQHLEPQLLERIATYFGFRAVKRLKLRQEPLPEQPRPRPRAAEPAVPAAVEAAVAAIDDPALKEALARLGARVAAEGRKSD